jgi:hypothetical protein
MQAYSKTVASLAMRIGVPLPEYQKLHVVAERARMFAARARVDLETHIAEHGC